MNKKSKYDRIARIYDLLDLPFEFRRYQPVRKIMFEGVRGRVLDAGVGTGRNMSLYPADGEMIGIDLSPEMLSQARKRQARLGIEVELLERNVLATDFPDGHFDTIVATFLFCVLDDEDQLPALRELRRICKADGTLRILEYAYSRNPVSRLIMRLWAPWVRMMYGATFDRHTEQYVEAAGFELVENRFLFKDIIKLLVLKPR
jgi:ubiquinone/menaquinone biosynthesis C-methylase UbiE